MWRLIRFGRRPRTSGHYAAQLAGLLNMEAKLAASRKSQRLGEFSRHTGGEKVRELGS